MPDTAFSAPRAGGLPMSCDVSIDVAGVGKVFPIYEKPHHRLFQMLSPRSRKRSRKIIRDRKNYRLRL